MRRRYLPLYCTVYEMAVIMKAAGVVFMSMLRFITDMCKKGNKISGGQ